MAPATSPPKPVLLLSSPPSPPTASSLHAAYHDPISATLSQLSPTSNLIIAIAAPFQPLQWSKLQALLAGIYSLIATIQTKSGSQAKCDVILVDHISGRAYPPNEPSPGDNSCTVLDLGAFASKKGQSWSHIFHHSTEAGFELVQSFLIVAERSQTILQKQIIPVPGGLSLNIAEGQMQWSGQPEARHKRIILGGTFDHFHAGHRLLLQAAALTLKLPPPNSPKSQQSVFVIGMSSDALLQNKKFASELEPWSTRAQSVIDFLSTILSSPLSPGDQTTIGEEHEIHATMCDGRLLVRCSNITDVYGPTTREEDLHALIVSRESRGGGKAVNDKRREQGWHELVVFEVGVLNMTDEEGRSEDDFSGKISSTYFRQLKAEARAKGGKI